MITPEEHAELMAQRVEGHKRMQEADKRQVSGNHYKDMPIRPWTVMEAVLTHEEFVGYLKGSVLKYALRAGRKEGSDDVVKARHYIEKLREMEKW